MSEACRHRPCQTLAALLVAACLAVAGQALADGDAVLESVAEQRLSGVVISAERRIAMIGGKTVSPGEQLGEWHVVAIERRGIRLRSDSAVRSIGIGEHFSVTTTTRANAPRLVLQTRQSNDRRYRVTSGDTLSDIALATKPRDLSLQSAMRILYDSNPHAFDGSPDALRSGAVLAMPDDQPGWHEPVARRHAAAAAPADTQAVVPSPDTASRVESVDVKPGDSLSGIAERIAARGTTREQMMLALYRSNPSAFGGNINRLFAGARLIVPGTDEIGGIAQADAVAEIARQHADWRAAKVVPELVASADH